MEMQQHIHHVYERQGKVMEEKMQELMACLERIQKLDGELAEFRKALQLLYHDIN
jgi:synaptonemal complex central element protein 2